MICILVSVCKFFSWSTRRRPHPVFYRDINTFKIEALHDEETCATLDYRFSLFDLFFNIFSRAHNMFMVTSLRHYIREGTSE